MLIFRPLFCKLILNTIHSAYIRLNRTVANIKTADPVKSPMTADKMINTSVRITSEGENSLHVAQLGIQAPDSSLRKKSC